MSRWLGVVLVGVFMLCNVNVGDASLPDVGGEPEAAVGGISWLCPTLGVLTGLSLATGQWIGAAGFVVSAIRAGCVV